MKYHLWVSNDNLIWRRLCREESLARLLRDLPPEPFIKLSAQNGAIFNLRFPGYDFCGSGSGA